MSDSGFFSDDRNLCPGSYLGCDSVVRARQIGECSFEASIRPDTIRVLGDPDGGVPDDAGVPCLMVVDSCEGRSGWQSEISDGGAIERMRFRLCGDACELATKHSDVVVEAIALCRE